MMLHATRTLAAPARSFFLFGPRGTGKTTWVRRVLPNAVRVDLLDSRTHLELSRDPGALRARLFGALKDETHEAKGTAAEPIWVILDEVQRVPELLNEVHALLNDHGDRLRFALTGSSARKLRRGGVNLLAGRAIRREMFPLTAVELGARFDLDRALRFGLLPAIWSDSDDDETRADVMDAYVSTYLREEIREEALVRSFAAFSRFWEVAALVNGQATNVSNIARDAQVARQTVQSYFEVLVDTLVGFWLPAWSEKVRVKQVEHPKFYFFDAGVVRASAGRSRSRPSAEERGPLLETYVLHELRAFASYTRRDLRLSYFRSPSGVEVDFIVSEGGVHIGIEVKATKRLRGEHTRALRHLLDEGRLRRGVIVYDGDVPLDLDGIRAVPASTFGASLDEILPAAG
jgi:predicted AAA+ superfamily ATPase